jgi:hypothetical protein
MRERDIEGIHLSSGDDSVRWALTPWTHHLYTDIDHFLRSETQNWKNYGILNFY